MQISYLWRQAQKVVGVRFIMQRIVRDIPNNGLLVFGIQKMHLPEFFVFSSVRCIVILLTLYDIHTPRMSS